MTFETFGWWERHLTQFEILVFLVNIICLWRNAIFFQIMISKQFHEDNVGLGNLVGGGDLIYSLYMRSCPPCITGGADGFETCCGQI